MFIPGDVLLYTAPKWNFSTVYSKIIQLITGNRITHVALYLAVSSIPGKHLILEALSTGIHIKTVTEDEIYIHEDGFVLCGISRLLVLPTNPVLLWSAAKYNTKPYGILTIINLLLQHGKTRLFPNKSWTSWFKSKNAYICSEVTQLVLEDVLKANQIKYSFKKDACLVEPDDYLSAPFKVLLLF